MSRCLWWTKCSGSFGCDSLIQIRLYRMMSTQFTSKHSKFSIPHTHQMNFYPPNSIHKRKLRRKHGNIVESFPSWPQIYCWGRLPRTSCKRKLFLPNIVTWAMKKAWSFTVYRGLLHTTLVIGFIISHYRNPYETASIKESNKSSFCFSLAVVTASVEATCRTPGQSRKGTAGLEIDGSIHAEMSNAITPVCHHR